MRSARLGRCARSPQAISRGTALLAFADSHGGSSWLPWLGNGAGLGRSNRAQDVVDAAVVAVIHQAVSGAGVDQLPFDIGAIELASMDELQQTERRAVEGVVSAALCGAREISDLILERSAGIGFGVSTSPIGFPLPHCRLRSFS